MQSYIDDFSLSEIVKRHQLNRAQTSNDANRSAGRFSVVLPNRYRIDSDSEGGSKRIMQIKVFNLLYNH